MTFPAIITRIFSLQMDLMERYREIEQLPNPPLSLHSINGQKIIKDFAWRTVEELTEAWQHANAFDERHELGIELADALHFFVELLIFAGITPQQCLQHLSGFPIARRTEDADVQVRFWTIVYIMGKATHFLHNRPWKQTPIPTNEGEFRKTLLVAYAHMLNLWAALGFSAEDMFNFYQAKHEVNRVRQVSKY